MRCVIFMCNDSFLSLRVRSADEMQIWSVVKDERRKTQQQQQNQHQQQQKHRKAKDE